MKIVMICDFYNESLSYQENILANYYVKFGHEVTVISSVFHSVFDYVNDIYDPKWSPRKYFSDGVKIIKLRYKNNILNRIRSLPPLDDVLREEQPDLIFVHDISLNLLDVVRYLKVNSDTKLIIDYHADYSNSGKNWLSLKILHGIIRKRVLDRARPFVKKIFPVIPGSARFLHEVYKVPYTEMELLPLGVDLDASRQVMLDQVGKELRKEHHIPSNAIVIFSGGKLTPTKQTDALIECFLKLNRSDIWLVIVGDSGDIKSGAGTHYMSTLRRMASGCNRIIFTGWLSPRQVLEYLDMSDFAVFPASQSILWQQAIGMGKPLIIGEPMAAPGGYQDVSYINLYGNIVLTDSHHSRARGLSDAINDLVVNPNKISQMSLGAHRVAAEILDWNSAVARTLQFNAPSH